MHGLRSTRIRLLLVAAVVAMLASSCRNDPTTSSPAPASPEPEHVCRLLTDAEADAIVGANVVAHRWNGPENPRSCTWLEGEPAQEAVVLGLAPQFEPVDPPTRSVPIGSPCEPGSRASTLDNPLRGPSLNATCMVDGLAVLLMVRTADLPSAVMLLQLAVPRLATVDRVALGLPPRPPPGAAPATLTPQAAPKECLDAWRAGRVAPVRCEEYPEAYVAVSREKGRP